MQAMKAVTDRSIGHLRYASVLPRLVWLNLRGREVVSIPDVLTAVCTVRPALTIQVSMGLDGDGELVVANMNFQPD